MERVCVLEVYVPFKFIDSKVSIFEQFYGIQVGHKSQFVPNNFIPAVILIGQKCEKKKKRILKDDLSYSDAIERSCSYSCSVERL